MPDISEVSGGAFYAGFDLLEVVHDREDGLHRGVVDHVHLDAVMPIRIRTIWIRIQ